MTTPSLTNPNPKREDERVGDKVDPIIEAIARSMFESEEFDWEAAKRQHRTTARGNVKNVLRHARIVAPQLFAPSPGDPVRAALEEACEPWSFQFGDPPEDDSPLNGVFGAGITYTEQHLAELLGVANFERGDGSEDFRTDAGNTLLNILAAAGLYDKDEARFAALSVSTPTGEGETLDTIRQWCEETFGPISTSRIVERAGEEFEELRAEPDNVTEAADVVICLSRFPGLWAEVERKMKINRGRRWRLMGDGTGYHIKDAPTSPSKSSGEEA